MSEFETSLEVNGKTIELGVDYLGDAPARWDEENYNNSELTVTVDGVSETFEVWGSRADPEFDTEYKLLNVFSLVCSEALDVIYDQTDEIVPDGMSFGEVRDLIGRLEDNADKITGSLDLSEDDLIAIVNNEDYQ